MLTHVELAEIANSSYDEKTVRLKHDLELLVERQGSMLAVSVRGSELNAKDWLSNFLIFPWRDKSIGWAPFGFLRRAQRVVKYLVQNERLDDYTYVYFTGHSAGAAIALLTAEILWKQGYHVSEVVGFAPPCTGKRKLRCQTTLYDHAGDPVCDVPRLWGQPIELEVLPDASDGPLQHAMSHYLDALRVFCDTGGDASVPPYV